MREAHRQAARQIWWLHNPRHTAWHLSPLQKGSQFAAARTVRPSSVKVVILIERTRHGKLPIVPSLPHYKGDSTEADNPQAAHYERMELK